MGKPRSKIDKWCYTASKTSARNRIKRLTNKAHRRDDKKLIGERFGEEYYEYV